MAIAALIGTGKTTLATKLAEKLRLPLILEDVSGNPYLEDFYNDKKKYGYALQIHLLTRRLKQNKQAAEHGGVCDRTLEEDRAFVQMLRKHNFIDGRDAATYQELIRHVTIHKPDVILWLDVTPEEAFARIKKRARPCEAGMTLWYMQELHKAYEELYQQLVAAGYTICRLNWNGSEEENATKVLEIVSMLEERQRQQPHPPVHDHRCCTPLVSS